MTNIEASKSRMIGHLADALLAEMLLGSIVDRAGATSWFEQTLAFAQSGARVDIDDAIDQLVLRGFATETAEGLRATEIGALTSRLMVDVGSAGELLRVLAELPIPTSATEAEELIVQTVALAVAGLRERPVNERTYSEYVTNLLVGWSPRALARADDAFGTRVCMAAAQLALREPARLREKPPVGISMAEFRRAIDDIPRFLAWVAALGYAHTATWAPAVAGDLARRLSWWHLQPQPQRGAGRLLWMLERMLEPENRGSRMQDLWRRARAAGFESPDAINGRPRDVDITAEAFADIVRGRADLQLDPLVQLELTYASPNPSARLTAMSNTGASRAITTSRPAQGPIDLVIPPGTSAQIAADVFHYTREGDFAYRSFIAPMPAGVGVGRAGPIQEATELLDSLPDLSAVNAGPRGLRSLLQGERKRRRTALLPLIAPDPQLRPVALALSEHRVEPDFAVLALRSNLKGLLGHSPNAEPRPPQTVLRSRVASTDEEQLTLAALIAALQLDAGVATADGHLLALVRLNDRWKLAAPRRAGGGRIEPIVPVALPPTLETMTAPRADNQPAAPRCSWMVEFTP